MKMLSSGNLDGGFLDPYGVKGHNFPKSWPLECHTLKLAVCLQHGRASVELPRNRVNVNLFLRHIRDLSR